MHDRSETIDLSVSVTFHLVKCTLLAMNPCGLSGLSALSGLSGLSGLIRYEKLDLREINHIGRQKLNLSW